MIVKMQLLNPRLEFFPPYRGRGRVHARRNGMSTSIPSVDLSTSTLCKQPITQDMQPLTERAVNVQKLCGNCYSTLRTYGFTQVAMINEKDEGEGVVA